jgi:hypothetical protein
MIKSGLNRCNFYTIETFFSETTRGSPAATESSPADHERLVPIWRGCVPRPKTVVGCPEYEASS